MADRRKEAVTLFSIGALALLGAVPLPAQQSSELPQWVLELSRIKRRAKASFERLPSYACLETVDRFDKPPRAPGFRYQDTLRLEVAVVGNKELYAPAGASRFEADEPSAIVARGSFSTGTFSTLVRNLFILDGARTTGWSAETIDGRGVLRYDYEIPQMFGPSRLRWGNIEAIVGERGSYWADAETLDVLEIEYHPVDIPIELNMLDVKTDIQFARMRIGSSDVLLPETADMIIANLDGRQVRNLTRFTGCREYHSESTITFGAELPAPPPPVPKKK